MKDLVQYIADWVVDDADAVQVDERERADRVVVRLEVAQEDMGRVIGKEGRIANAMRTLLKISGAVRDRQTSLEIR